MVNIFKYVEMCTSYLQNDNFKENILFKELKDSSSQI